MYADYSFYRSPFGGSFLSEAEFPALERRAELHIDLITLGRLRHQPITDQVKMAVCAVAEVLKRYEQTERAAETAVGLKSENNDGYGVTYQDPAAARAALFTLLTEAARPYLIYIGLMDRSAQ